MKPDKNTCLNCGKEISARAKYCSEACRKAYARNPDKKADKPNPDTDKPQVGQNSDKQLTKTDKTFYDRAMKDFGEPYYNFTEKVAEKQCLQCGQKFKTGMALLRFCSYQHYSDAIRGKV